MFYYTRWHEEMKLIVISSVPVRKKRGQEHIHRFSVHREHIHRLPVRKEHIYDWQFAGTYRQTGMSIYTERSYIEQLARQNTQPQFSLQKIRICDRNQSNHHPSVL